MSKGGASTKQNLGEIDGRQYQISSNGVARCPIPPGGEVSRNAHVTVPHPDREMRRDGWRIEIIFLQIATVVACAAMIIGVFAYR